MDYDGKDLTRTAELRAAAVESERSHKRALADTIATLEDKASKSGWVRGFCFGALTVVLLWYLYTWLMYG